MHLRVSEELTGNFDEKIVESAARKTKLKETQMGKGGLQASTADATKVLVTRIIFEVGFQMIEHVAMLISFRHLLVARTMQSIKSPLSFGGMTLSSGEWMTWLRNYIGTGGAFEVSH